MMARNLLMRRNKDRKEFGELVSIKSPLSKDIDRLSKSILSPTESSDVEDENSRDLRLELLPELPSHVPTPETIDHIDGLAGINERLQSMFNGDSDDDEVQDYKNNTLKGGIESKQNIQSLITPPESPVSSKTITPSKTRWGADFWYSKMISNHIISPVSSLGSGKSFDETNTSDGMSTIDDKTNDNDNEVNKDIEKGRDKDQDLNKHIGTIDMKKRIGTIDIPKISSYSNNSSNLSYNSYNNYSTSSTRTSRNRRKTQEALLMEAMSRKKTNPPPRQDRLKKTMSSFSRRPAFNKRPPSPSSSVGKNTTVKKHSPTVDHESEKPSTKLILSEESVERTTPVAAVTKKSTATNKPPVAPALQRQWMHENALNLHASCQRESIYDKEDRAVAAPVHSWLMPFSRKSSP